MKILSSHIMKAIPVTPNSFPKENYHLWTLQCPSDSDILFGTPLSHRLGYRMCQCDKAYGSCDRRMGSSTAPSGSLHGFDGKVDGRVTDLEDNQKCQFPMEDLINDGAEDSCLLHEEACRDGDGLLPPTRQVREYRKNLNLRFGNLKWSLNLVMVVKSRTYSNGRSRSNIVTDGSSSRASKILSWREKISQQRTPVSSNMQRFV